MSEVANRRDKTSQQDVADIFSLRANTQPPANIQAEQALLGAVLANNRAFNLVAAYLRPEHFMDPVHGAIYKACAKLIAAGHLADAVTLKNVFSDQGQLAEVGGTPYLAQLLTAMVGVVNAGEYGRVIHDTWIRRQLSDIGAGMVTAAYTGDIDGQDQLNAATEALMELTGKGVKDAPLVSIGDAARAALEAAEAAARGDTCEILRSGLEPLDKLLGGFRNSWMYVIGGRPSMGKSSLVLQAAIGVSRALLQEELNAPPFTAAGGQVLFMSLEMPAEQLGGWAACHIAQISNEALRGERGFTMDEGYAFIRAQAELDTLPIQIIDAVGMSGPAMALRARSENQKRRVRLVIVDHVQKVVSAMHSEARGRFDTTAETSKVTSALKDLSRQLDCPVVALAQLKGDVDNRDNPRPRLGDLMYAGAADADVVCFVFRQERYLPKSPPQKDAKETEEKWAQRKDHWERQWAQARNRAELIVEKHRQGDCVTRTVGFDGSRSTFFGLEEAAPPDLWGPE